MIPDLLVEVCEDRYLPVTATVQFKAHRIKYHVLESTLQDLIWEIVPQYWLELRDGHIYDDPEPEADCQILELLITEVLHEEGIKVVNIVLGEAASEFVVNVKSIEAFNLLIEEIIQDMDVTGRTILYRPGNYKHKSKTLNQVMDCIIEREIMSVLIDNVATSGDSTLMWSASDRLIDGIVTDVLMEHFFSLQNTEFSSDVPFTQHRPPKLQIQ
ncbi:hypothetical protein HDU76_005205 [Blyttiomyces sp. JEL0837]|nr:hypothetical protein HDU76_005205 [Blyttiomyces sp. JEL0837]